MSHTRKMMIIEYLLLYSDIILKCILATSYNEESMAKE